MQTANLQYAPISTMPVVHVSQYDVGRQFRFKLYDGLSAFSMPTGTTARIDGIKPDNHGFSYTDKVSVSGNIATITTTEQMTVLAGTVKCEIRFIKNHFNVGTLNFLMIVEKSPLDSDTDVSETEIPAIVEVATANMLDAEAWARGTKEDVPVDSSAPQYHNNSKYYSEQAAASARDSANQAANASLSQVSALASADNAHASEVAALASANNAHASEVAAAASATAATAAADKAEAYSVNVPYIGANGNWWIWNTTTGAYVDSHVDASITVTIADITMLEPNETPRVTNTGTDTDPIFHLFIPKGNGIAAITKTSTSGLVDTYTISYTNGTTSTFTVTNGRGISNISKTNTSGLNDTYTITYNDGTTSTFTVTNGKTAYQSAVEGGYDRTEQEFYEELGNFADLVADAEAAADRAETLADGVEEIATQYGITGFQVNFETGDLMYENNGQYSFSVNTTDGELEWEVYNNG